MIKQDYKYLVTQRRRGWEMEKEESLVGLGAIVGCVFVAALWAVVRYLETWG